MSEREQIGRSRRDLTDIVQFTEDVSTKIRGKLDEAEVYTVVREEFAKSERYNASILLLTEDGSKLAIVESSLPLEKLKAGEKTAGGQRKGYEIDLSKSRTYRQVVREGKTIEADVRDIIDELFPESVASGVSEITGYEKKFSVLTPLSRHGKTVGALAVSSADLADRVIPSVKNLARHISTALQSAYEHNERRRGEQAMHRSTERLTAFMDSAPDAFALFDSELNLVEFNRVGLSMWPSETEKEDLIGKNVAELIPNAKETGRYDKYMEVMKTGTPLFMDDVVPHDEFGEIHLAMKAFKVGDGLGIIATDITERTRTEEALQESQRKVESLHGTARRLAACKSEGEVYELTVEAAEKILDFSLCTLDIVEGHKLVVKATSSQSPPEASKERVFDDGLAGKTYLTQRTYVFGSLDEVPEARPTQTEFKSGISAPIGDMGVFQAASTQPNAFTKHDSRMLELLLGHTVEALRRIRLQNELKEQAIRDPLTGIYNRYYLNEALEKEVKRSKRYNHAIAFLMIDINRFKEINDRFGHQMGDKVLQLVASLLLEEVRDADIVVRYGGDEFLVILPETNGEATVVKKRIAARVARRSEADKLLDFPVTLSIGSAYWRPDSSESVEEILSKADSRMYEDKRKQATREGQR